MQDRVKIWAPDVACLGGPQVTQVFRYSEDLRFSSIGGERLEGSEKAPSGCSVEASLCLGQEKWRGSDGRRLQSSRREAGEVMDSGCILKAETIGLDVEGERERGESG